MHHIYWHLHKILWVESLKRLKYSQLSLSRTPLGPAISVCLGESHIKGVKKRQGPTLGVRFTEVSILQGCLLKESRLHFKTNSQICISTWGSLLKDSTLNDQVQQVKFQTAIK